MSEEQLKAFLEKVEIDTELQDKLNGAADSDAVVEIAKEAGFSITAEETVGWFLSMQSAKVELSDEQLEGLAGGWNFRPSPSSSRCSEASTCVFC